MALAQFSGGNSAFLPVKHIPLAPFNSPHPPRCQHLVPSDDDFDDEPVRCGRPEDSLAHAEYGDSFHHTFDPAPYVQRSHAIGGSKDDRISEDKQYLAKIHGQWYLGTFDEVWFGWSFNGWHAPYQLDSIEDLYEVDLGSL